MDGYLGQMAKKSFWNAYDHLGGCILASLLWSLLSLPWFALALILLTAGWEQIAAGRALFGLMLATGGVGQLMVSPLSAALWAVTARWVHYRDASVRDFFPLLRKHFVRALGLWLFFTLGTLLLALNALFYQRLLGRAALVGAFAAGLMGWALFFLYLVQMYALPLLVQEDLSIRNSLRRSTLVVLDNIWYSIFLFSLLSLVLIIGLISVVGLLFFCAALAGVIANTGLREILKRYEPQKKEGKPETWAEVREDQERTLEEPRGWRDLWKPWAG